MATSPVSPPPSNRQFALLALTALGVVYGDIGTSPLYALRECFHGPVAIDVTPANVLGVLSLVVWALVLVISVKYLIFILRADNHGEGGILALTALVAPLRGKFGRRQWVVVTLGLLGSALLYADGMITPAISVLSAVEGLEVATPLFSPYVVPTTIVILIGLFLFQSRGTAHVGAVFGPIILVWFAVLAGLGVWNLVDAPEVIAAVNPWHAVEFFLRNHWHGFIVLGSVFLVVTGGEALYADIGHFGARPIRWTWFLVVLPSLILNYFGQGAYLLLHPEIDVNPFFAMAPKWMLLPLVALATAAAVIASQAIITGAYSLTFQAIQLGCSPRLRIEHTSRHQIGQIFVPTVNWILMIACIALVLGFKSSTNLASAYGLAITITMVITTLLFFELIYTRWRWGLPAALLLAGFFLMFDLAFLGANLIKVESGGWFPLLMAGAIYTVLSTWRSGRELVGRRLRERLIPLDLFVADLLSQMPTRVPGTAIFMSGNPVGTPPALRHNVLHNKVLHQTVVVLCVETADVPHVALRERIEVEEIGEGIWRILLHFGFMDRPDVQYALTHLQHPQIALTEEVSYFVGHETLLASRRATGLMLWRERLFVWLARNAFTAITYFNLPADRVVEIGAQVEL